MQAWKWFDAAGQHLPDYVIARDIMCANYPRLRDIDTLSDAIDAFCRFGVSELPGVDEDGDLVGVVSEDELIRLGLPEYITWMEDLSPILNFQPFAEILRREANVPVIEIMAFADRYATINETSPAIQVAKVMIRRDVRQAYVVRDKQLAGVISIQDFIQKVLRACSVKNLTGMHTGILIPAVMLMAALGSAFVDNVIFVAAFVPVVKKLVGEGVTLHPLWWALLFGACFGGNITMIGSTANIGALGMVEKRYRLRIHFLEWFRVGLAAGLVASLVAWLCLLVTGPLMLSR
nr:CBS domain-containing protein [Gammaproteobacteria bacterium]